MNDHIDDLLKKIHPVHPRFARRLWQAYLAADAKERGWVEHAAKHFLASTLREDYRHEQVLLPPPKLEVARGEYVLGQVTYAGLETDCSFGLREGDWIQHVAILGRTGTGKTNLGALILKRLAQARKPFLVLDWKRNYRDLLAHIPQIQVFTAGRDVRPFRFNPWIPPPGTPVDVWTKKIIEVAVHAYFAGEGVIDVLLRALHEAYLASGAYHDKAYPSTSDVIRVVRETIRETPRQAQWKASALRVLRSIDFGPMAAITRVDKNDFDDLLEGFVIIELDTLADSDKTFLCEALMLWILQRRLREQVVRERLRHVLVVEEAHHLFLRRHFQDSEPITDVMLREIRELGVGVVLLDQHPSLMTLPALGNPNTTICFNLKTEQDVHAAAQSMLVPRQDEDILGRLPVGDAVVRVQGRHPAPFTIRVPLVLAKKGIVTDDDLVPRRAPLLTVAREREPRGHELLLKDIALNPFSTSLERYQRLAWNPRVATEHVAKLKREGLVKEVLVQRRTGRFKLFDLTSAGRRALEELGIKHSFPSQLEHTYWKRAIQDSLRARGYDVVEEHQINGYADLVAKHDGKVFALEIETGKSDYVQNIAKCLASPDHFTQIICAATSSNAAKQIAKRLAQRGLHPHPKITLTTTKQLDHPTTTAKD